MLPVSSQPCISPCLLLCMFASMSASACSFRLGRQEDAHEYLVALLDAMHESYVNMSRPKPSPELSQTSMIYRIFAGKIRSQVCIPTKPPPCYRSTSCQVQDNGLRLHFVHSSGHARHQCMLKAGFVVACCVHSTTTARKIFLKLISYALQHPLLCCE